MYGGRWNSVGTRMVYTASSIALATLELLVNLESEALLDKYYLNSVELDEQLIIGLDAAQLPDDWRAEPPSIRTKEIGDRWVADGASVALAVPSAVIPDEDNILLNPDHPDFAKVAVGPPSDYFFDRRIGK